MLAGGETQSVSAYTRRVNRSVTIGGALASEQVFYTKWKSASNRTLIEMIFLNHKKKNKIPFFSKKKNKSNSNSQHNCLRIVHNTKLNNDHDSYTMAINDIK